MAPSYYARIGIVGFCVTTARHKLSLQDTSIRIALCKSHPPKAYTRTTCLPSNTLSPVNPHNLPSCQLLFEPPRLYMAANKAQTPDSKGNFVASAPAPAPRP